MNKYLKLLLSIPKIIYVNFKAFPVNIAFKFPMLVSFDVVVKGLHKNSISINQKVSSFMIKYGFQEGTLGVPSIAKKSYLILGKEGRLCFDGQAQFAKGISLRVDRGEVLFGKNFTCNKCCFIACNKKIVFGENVLIGWHTNVRDMDGHNIYVGERNDENIQINEKEIVIGDDVWIAAYVDILKGTKIPNGCIVAYRSCVFKEFREEKCIIAGYPAKIVKRDILWT
jgi:acetyltransferase-like isoleucine patch superfamily enzyme